MKRIGYAIAVLLTWVATGFANAGTTPEPVAKVCMNCHGIDGNSESPMFPRLAGQQPDYIQRQLLAYREQSRANPAAQNYMWGLARSLSDGDIKQLSTWFSTQTPVYEHAAAQVSTNQHVADSIYHNGLPDKGVPACASCHGERAEGTAIAPRLAGQHTHYLADQLRVLATGERPAATLMQPIAQKLDDEQVAALAAYLGHL